MNFALDKLKTYEECVAIAEHLGVPTLAIEIARATKVAVPETEDEQYLRMILKRTKDPEERLKVFKRSRRGTSLKMTALLAYIVGLDDEELLNFYFNDCLVQGGIYAEVVMVNIVQRARNKMRPCLATTTDSP